MNFTPSDTLPGVVVIDPDVYDDDRGYFHETYQRERFLQYNLSTAFVQDNISYSKKNVVRGIHYQLKRPQGKLIYAVHGEIYDVAVDIRRDSPTFGQWTGTRISSEDHRMVYIPEGYAHGFSVLSDTATVVYKCTDYYSPLDEFGIVFNDPGLGIDWQVKSPVLSERDLSLPPFQDIPEDKLPVFRP
jgi:dTDP-4-dehydrorhamnose 3,5-epimerase